ncbi:hypothetical protein SAMN04489798_4502 [Pseudomonas arsenicoxydans]|uniref:Uncharacterized protein n=2 Tax=Pseudomonas arsenicoxydans TaxID=702115 RepID=A0A1H0PDR8_9PSED|nr:hypothetical protein SAMN04489798_4502 [Pseudomonas arsenicoxydans]
MGCHVTGGISLKSNVHSNLYDSVRVYYQYQSIRNQLAMSALNEESRQIVASLAHRVGPNADTARIANAIVLTLQDMDKALTPIIGQQGVAALFRRSLHLCANHQARLVGSADRVLASQAPAALMSILVEQSDTDALLFGEVLLMTYYELLTKLIGPSLTARLLRGVLEPFLSDISAQEKSP